MKSRVIIAITLKVYKVYENIEHPCSCLAVNSPRDKRLGRFNISRFGGIAVMDCPGPIPGKPPLPHIRKLYLATVNKKFLPPPYLLTLQGLAIILFTSVSENKLF
jgi:hypothetical protein